MAIELLEIDGKKLENPDLRSYRNSAELPPEVVALIEKAKVARLRAEPQWSGFCVGAALETREGKYFTGSNEEPSSTDVLCAERLAISSARHLHRASELRINRIAIVSAKDGLRRSTKITFPCGRCLQILFDYEERQAPTPIQIICASLTGPVQVFHQVNSYALLSASLSTDTVGPSNRHGRFRR